MRQTFNDVFKIVQLLISVGFLVTGCVSLAKGDPLHIPLSYISASWMLQHMVKEDLL